MCYVYRMEWILFLKSKSCVKLLGVDVDPSLSFKDHLSRTCKKAGGHLNVLSRLSNSLTTDAKLALVRGYILSHFKFCPTEWHFCSTSNTPKNGKDPGKSFTMICIL